MSDLMTFEVDVTQRIKITLDASKFDAAFADEFNTTIFYAGDPEDDDGLAYMLREHAEHIAQLQAREIWDNRGFIEGYGDVREMGITAETMWTETDVSTQAPTKDVKYD